MGDFLRKRGLNGSKGKTPRGKWNTKMEHNHKKRGKQTTIAARRSCKIEFVSLYKTGSAQFIGRACIIEMLA